MKNQLTTRFLLALSFAAFVPFGTPAAFAATGVHFSPVERHVIELIDAREPVDSLVPFLTDSDPHVAWRAAVGLANLGDTAARKFLIPRIKLETRDEVLDAVTFAIGILGPNAEAMDALASLAVMHPSRESWMALGRVAPKDRMNIISKIAQKSLERHVAKPVVIADMMVRLAIRKLWTDESLVAVDQLLLDDDAEVRWRAAYAFSRVDDSLKLSVRLDALSKLLDDLGKPEIRMFTATAIGHIHNPESESVLIHALRGETDWRVRVNIVNALSSEPTLDTDAANALEHVVDISTADLLTENVAVAAIHALERALIAGKFRTSKDSTALVTWAHAFAPRFEEHSEVPTRVASMTLPLVARIGATDLNDEMTAFSNFADVFVRINCLHAAAVLEDPAPFSQVLSSIGEYASSPVQQLFRLETLDSLWQRAKQHPSFRAQLESMKYANAYRHMLIRISSLVTEPEIVTTALSQIEDSTIIFDDTFRSEAESYVLGYLHNFRDAMMHDQLLSAIDAARWLKPKSDSIKTELYDIYKQASSEGHRDIRDSTANAMSAIGYRYTPLPLAKPKRDPIDWGMLESAPDTLLINGARGTTFVTLYRYEAPLSSLNMIKLAKNGYLANTIYHRVVPNFVVQSGDRTMSGFGGPGYSIRTEIAPIYYDEAGMLGMASDGKDTEGSQWFITHCPTPHLDGHYTIFGKVVKGMNLIDNIQLGDAIESIMPLKHR
jgi:cyclophilin family peptidyl-prolyl cis-trans isomerase/HEAT repeat protein